MSPLWGALQRMREYNELANIGEIARRYFAMNAFDGVLTIIGVLMGSMLAGVEEARIVLSTGLATCVAMGVSGLWGAYLTESAERKREIAELEQQTLLDLRNSRVGRASRVAVITVALVDGISPFIAALFALIPFFFAGILPSIMWAYYSAIAISLLTLFGLGMFLGHVSRENLYLYGLRTLVAGVVSIAISLLVGGE